MEKYAQCHGGIGESLGPAFACLPGQPLENYIRLQRPDANAAVDVHGNQVALTQRSRRYQDSQMLHDVPLSARARTRGGRLFGKVPEVPQKSECGDFANLGAKIRDNYIDCHRPVQESNLIISNLNRKQIKARMRNHWIKAYSAPGN